MGREWPSGGGEGAGREWPSGGGEGRGREWPSARLGVVVHPGRRGVRLAQQRHRGVARLVGGGGAEWEHKGQHGGHAEAMLRLEAVLEHEGVEELEPAERGVHRLLLAVGERVQHERSCAAQTHARAHAARERVRRSRPGRGAAAAAVAAASVPGEMGRARRTELLRPHVARARQLNGKGGAGGARKRERWARRGVRRWRWGGPRGRLSSSRLHDGTDALVLGSHVGGAGAEHLVGGTWRPGVIGANAGTDERGADGRAPRAGWVPREIPKASLRNLTF